MVRTDYLQKMGVTCWVPRKQSAAQVFCYSLKNSNNKVIGLLLSEKSDDLLEKIGLALTKNMSIELFSPEKFLSCDAKFIVTFGSHININFFNKNTDIIRSVAVSALSQDPNHKKNLWEKIKLYRDLFHENS